MAIHLDPNAEHTALSANTHFYREQTAAYYMDRTLPAHDFIYLIDGSWAITEGSREYSLQPGDVLLLSAGRHHYNRLPCQAGTRTFCVHISCAPTDTPETPHVLTLPTHIPLAGNPVVRQLFEQLVSVHWSDGPLRQARLCALSRLLILELAAAAQTPKDQRTGLADRAIAILMRDPHRRIGTAQMAQQLYVSEKTLNTAMREKTGQSFYAYEKSLKLEMVASQLKTEPETRISEIAEAFGFHDEFHLSNAFKQKYGLSPRNYRTTP